MNNVMAIYRKEVGAYFKSPMAYISWYFSPCLTAISLATRSSYSASPICGHYLILRR